MNHRLSVACNVALLLGLIVPTAWSQLRGDVAATAAVNAQIVVHVQEAGGGTVSVPAQVKLISTNNPLGSIQMAGIGGATTFNVAVGTYTIEVNAGGYRTARDEVMATGVSGVTHSYIVLRRDDGKAGAAQASDKPKAAEVTGKSRKELDLAVDALRKGKPADGQKHIEYALKHAAGNPDVQYIAALCALGVNDVPHARQYLESAVTLFPEHAAAQTALGGMYMQQGKMDEAIAHLQRALGAEPNSWRAHRLIAEAYLNNNRDLTKAQFHARRALDLGKEKAAGADAILARAEAASHPQQVLTATPPVLSMPSTLLADVPTGPIRTLPPKIDELRPPTDPTASCALESVLAGAATRSSEFTDAMERFSATETFVHDELDSLGVVRKSYNDSFQYLATMKWPSPDLMILSEMRNGRTAVSQLPVPYVTEGVPAIGLIFHSAHQSSFTFTCEGLGHWHGQPAWQVRFEQRSDKPARIHDWAEKGQSYPMILRGRAWISAGSFHLLRVETELVKPIPEIRLELHHMTIEYAPVKSNSGTKELWLPSRAEVYSKFRGRVFRQQHDFGNFVLFSVDASEKIKDPTAKD